MLRHRSNQIAAGTSFLHGKVLVCIWLARLRGPLKEVVMIDSMLYSNRRWPHRLLLLLAVGLACACNWWTRIAQPATAVPLSATAIAQQPATPAPQAASELDPTGPWLLISTDKGLWAANRDASHPVQLTQGEFWQNGLSKAIQPHGNRVVLLTSGDDRYRHLALNFLALPDGRVQKITNLTTPQTEPGSTAAPGDPSLEAVRAIVEQPAFAWSPDGTKLAFIGVLDGPSAEVYLYDTITTKITRISHDDAQNFWPSWSPDGKHILYFGADGFGTGAGIMMKGVWSANGDGTNVTWLYETSSAGEELVGWTDDQTAVLATWNPVCGSGALRLYNVVNSRKTILEQGCLSAAAVGRWLDTQTSAVMFGKETGLYLLPGGSDKTVRRSDKKVTSITWEQAGFMFVVTYDDGTMTTFYSPDGRTEDAPAKVQDVTMFALIWAWTNHAGPLPGVWISGPGINLGQVSYKQAYAPIWDQKNNTLWFFSSGETGTDLYGATFASHYSDAALVAHLDASVQEVAWVGQFK